MKNSLNIKIYFFILLIFMITTGCSPHKLRTEEYNFPIPEKYNSEVQIRDLTYAKDRWWEHFNDERLNSLIEEALRKNLDIKQALERYNQSQAILRSVKASQWLTLSLQAEAGRTSQQLFNQPLTSDTYRLSAAAAYEIDLWGRLSARSKAAHLDYAASKEDLMALQMSISASVGDLYFFAVSQQEQLKLIDKIISSFRDMLQLVELRYAEGLTTALDVYQSRQNLLIAEAQRHIFESNLSIALHALSVLAGRTPQKDRNLVSDTMPESLELTTGVPSDLLIKRPDIKAAMLRLTASDERYGAAIADRLPSFNLVGTYGGASESLKTLLSSPNILWNLLIEVFQPVVDGGRLKAEADRAEAIFRERLSFYQNTILQALKEVEDALAKNEESTERLELLDKRFETSEAELRLAIDNYLHGVADYMPVLIAQQRYYEAGRSIIETRHSLISARIALARSLGGYWMESEVEKLIKTTQDRKEESN
jgi:NodT family efflux transporter outer membrane factor (OMF) lipoprotein